MSSSKIPSSRRSTARDFRRLSHNNIDREFILIIDNIAQFLSITFLELHQLYHVQFPSFLGKRKQIRVERYVKLVNFAQLHL